MNKIVKVEIQLLELDHYQVEITKAFAKLEDIQVFRSERPVPGIYHAIDVARGMVAAAPAHRTDGGAKPK